MKSRGFIFFIFLFLIFLFSSLTFLLFEFIEQETKRNNIMLSQFNQLNLAQSVLAQFEKNIEIPNERSKVNFNIDQIIETPTALIYHVCIKVLTKGDPLVLKVADRISRDDKNNKNAAGWQRIKWSYE